MVERCWCPQMDQETTKAHNHIPLGFTIFRLSVNVFKLYSFQLFQNIWSFRIFSTEAGEMVLKQKNQLLEDLSKLEADILKRWCIDISQIIPLNLAKSLLRQENQNLILNFDPTVNNGQLSPKTF